MHECQGRISNYTPCLWPSLDPLFLVSGLKNSLQRAENRPIDWGGVKGPQGEIPLLPHPTLKIIIIIYKLFWPRPFHHSYLVRYGSAYRKLYDT